MSQFNVGDKIRFEPNNKDHAEYGDIGTITGIKLPSVWAMFEKTNREQKVNFRNIRHLSPLDKVMK